MKIIHKDGKLIVVEDTGEERVIPLSESDDEERSLDFSDEVEHMTISQMRTYLATLEPLATRKKQVDESFATFLRDGARGLTPEQRALSTDTTGGGYLIPATFRKQIISAMQAYDPILAVATEISTPNGSAGQFPIDDDVVSGAIVAESGTSNTTAVTFDAIAFVKCPQHRSSVIRVPLELMEDAFTVFESLIGPILARRLARSVASTATAKLLTDADVAATTAAAGTVLGSEILDLMGAVDPAHSQVGAFLMNESTLTSLKKQTAYTAGYFPNMIGTDAQGRTTVFGKTVFSSPSMPNIGSSNKPIAFGNLSRFYMRTVQNSLTLKSYPERYAEYGQTAFEAFWRAQGALAKSASTPVPVRLLACHS